jgi:hypothetical protein
VETTGYAWRKNEYLLIEFIGANSKSAMRLPGVVVHHSARGAGLMFDAISNEQRRMLRVLISRLMATDESPAVEAAGQDPRAVA